MPVACGKVLMGLEGNITGPTSQPFNESSYVCNWRLVSPEYAVKLDNNTSMTLMIKVTGYLGGYRTTSGRNCILTQYLELRGKIKDSIQFLITAHRQ